VRVHLLRQYHQLIIDRTGTFSLKVNDLDAGLVILVQLLQFFEDF